MQPRLQRYEAFLQHQYIPSLVWNQDYSIAHVARSIVDAARSGRYRRILFTGMGCSAIVSDAIKGFFACERIPTYIEVINDYDLDYLCSTEALAAGDTLVIISSYSGYSQEPIHAYHRIKHHTGNVVCLTSGGRLEKIAQEDGLSLIHWRLRNPDREYPLFHVPQYLAILLDVLHKLGFLPSNYLSELQAASDLLHRLADEKIRLAEGVARRLRDRDIIFLASPRWHLALLKLVDMHFNEMAMARAHRNHVHEFSHSEVAVLSDPDSPHAIVVFEDQDEDEYSRAKVRSLEQLLTSPAPQNRNIEFVSIDVEGRNFFDKIFSTLLFTQYIALSLGRYYDTPSRELISQAAGNPWYNRRTIQAEGREKVG